MLERAWTKETLAAPRLIKVVQLREFLFVARNKSHYGKYLNVLPLHPPEIEKGADIVPAPGGWLLDTSTVVLGHSKATMSGFGWCGLVHMVVSSFWPDIYGFKHTSISVQNPRPATRAPVYSPEPAV